MACCLKPILIFWSLQGPSKTCARHYSCLQHDLTDLCIVVQAHTSELAGPLTISAAYARSQNAATPQQASIGGGKSSKMATFTSATLSRATTLKNRVLAPTAAAPAIHPGQESLPANRGKPPQLVTFGVVLLLFACSQTRHSITCCETQIVSLHHRFRSKGVLLSRLASACTFHSTNN